MYRSRIIIINMNYHDTPAHAAIHRHPCVHPWRQFLGHLSEALGRDSQWKKRACETVEGHHNDDADDDDDGDAADTVPLGLENLRSWSLPIFERCFRW